MCTNRAHNGQFIFSVFVEIRFFLQTDGDQVVFQPFFAFIRLCAKIYFFFATAYGSRIQNLADLASVVDATVN